MNSIPISEFKANCSRLIERVRNTRQPLSITRHGIAVAEVVPAGTDRKRRSLGNMTGTAEILGDIISPVIDLDDFEAYRE
jgi:prevent-host-death family protein